MTRHPVWRWEPYDHVNVNLGSSGPARVDTSNADPDYRPRPVGFTADLGTAKPDKESHEAALARVPQHLTLLTGTCPECGDTDGWHFRSCPANQAKENQ